LPRIPFAGVYVTKIAVLSELVRNRIAAGEVVERPASAVKELVENSLDAGARRIDVEIERGGRHRIRVSDDGCGMGAEDLALSIQRFATSKLRNESDLTRVTTLGFRGEALPSIASVAEVEIASCPPGGEAGCRLRAEPGEAARALEPAPASPGTVVEVRNLFARTPARLKFLRSDATETRAVAEVVQRLALARPDVGFGLRADGKELVSTAAGDDLRARVASVLGRETARDLVDVAAGEPGWLAVGGLATAPGGATRADGKWGFLYLNGRPVRDRLLWHAAGSAYESLVPRGRYPVYVLMLDLDPSQVDVNVHPAKLEVRFREPHAVHDFVRGSLREALKKAGADLPADERPWTSGGAGGGVREGAAPAAGEARDRQRAGAWAQRFDLWTSPAAVEVHGGTFAREAGGAFASGAAIDARIVGTLRTGFILIETAEDLRIVDPHALHERLLYERMRAAAEGGRADSQALLVPETVELTPAESAAFEAAREHLGRLGFVAENFGARTAVIRGVPEGVPPSAAGEILREVLADLAADGGGSTAEPIEKVRRSLACRAAVKLGDRLDESEVEALLSQAREAPAACPHGRPVAWVLRHADIAHRLGR